VDKPGSFMLYAYALLSTINVWAASKRKWIPFSVSKSFLMLALMGVYSLNSSSVSILVLSALFFAWLGDLLLLTANKRMGQRTRSALYQRSYSFVTGGIAFFICHFCYILTFCQMFESSIVWPYRIIIIVVYLYIGIWFYKSFIQDMSGLNKLIKFGIAAYVFVILLMSYSSIWITTPHNSSSFLPLTGSLFFILSDYLLAIGYKTNSDFRYHPWVMACYLIAQFLIIMGLILLGA